MAIVTATGTSSPITVAGLPAGSYTFTVAATNGLGTGPSSASSSAQTVTAGGGGGGGGNSGAAWSYEGTSLPSTNDWWFADPGDNNSGGNVDFATNNNWLIAAPQINGSTSDILTIVNDSSATDGACLRMKCRPTSSSEKGACGNSNYVGAQLVSKNNWRSGYWEWRMRTPVVGNGMWPCLWLYNNCTNNGHTNVAGGHESDEIDIAEIFGGISGSPGNQFTTTLHGVSSDANHGLGLQSRDTIQWHTYGVDYNPNTPKCDIYYDGQKVASDNSGYVSYYRNGASDGGATPFNIRINYSINTGGANFFPAVNGTPTFYWDIDYSRYYTTKP